MPMSIRTMRWKRGAGAMAGLLALVVAAACSGEGDGPLGPGNGGGTPQPVARAVATVEVSPGTIALQVNETRQISATPLAADRTPLTDRAVQWTSSDSSVAFVTQHGTVWARSPGSVTLTATVDGKQGQAVVDVLPPPPPPSVAYVRITPGDVTLTEDPATWQLVAKTYAADGAELSGRPIAWASSDSARLRVHDGRVLPYGSGTVTVTASSEGKQARVLVTIPEWQRAMQLRGAAGLPLPATVSNGSYVDDRGVTHTVRRVVTDGAMRHSFTGGRYEQRLTVQTYEDGVLAGTQAYFDRGTLMYDLWEGTPVFTSTLYAGHTFRSTYAADGTLAVTLRIGGEGAPATFLFRK
ncbi:MAG: Ig-like domain-containing protein [Gemmatimonadota bacterium]